MISNVYTVKNTLSNLCLGLEVYPNDSFASVTITDLIHKRKESLNDFQLFRVGSFDNEVMRLELCDPVLIEWDNRHAIENKMSNVDIKEALAEMLNLR